ncbi:HEPN domain-containing protein [Oribacterium sp. NK2B42]|uniref:HEPN domain-containing protein n=1 Tax=Oribacterium sp. NK2B42 TaxID=689781 RepID=UPI0003FC7C8F|nr:HEPN domain-containing protein [Oribacterium sp. NK2B42]
MQHEEIGTKEDLAKYRLDTAKTDLKSAKLLLENEDYKGANNRAYYAIYHAVSAVHALDGKSYKRHKDALGNFNKDYVRTEVFPKDMGRKIAKAEEIRHASDYDDFYIASKEETVRQIETAEDVVDQIAKYISSI